MATEKKNDPGAGVADALSDAYDARVDGEADADARLDNRRGDDRPEKVKWPAKPQQVDGPDVQHQVEHTRRTLAKRKAAKKDRVGAFSPGPHGLSDESVRVDGQTEAEGGPLKASEPPKEK